MTRSEAGYSNFQTNARNADEIRVSNMKNIIAIIWRNVAIGLMAVAVAVVAGMSFFPAEAAEVLLETASPIGKHANVSVLLAVTRAENRLVAVGERGIILLSDDQGANWRQAKVPVSVALANVHFVSAKKGWAVGHGGVVLYSSDGGENWSKQLDGKQAAQIELDEAKAEMATRGGAEGQRRVVEAERLVADGPDKPFLDVFFQDEANGLIVGAYGLIFATHDGGNSWKSLKTNIDNPKGKHLYCIYSNGNEIYISGEQGALYRSNDGARNFIELMTPYVGTYFGVITTTSNDLVVYGLRGNVYRSNNKGATWQKVDVGLPVTLTAGTRLTDGAIVLVDETGRVLKSSDGGQKFVPLPVPQASSFTGVVQAADGNLIMSGARGLTRLTLKAKSVEPKL